MAFRFDKLTIKAQEAIQRAHGLAQDLGNPQIQPLAPDMRLAGYAFTARGRSHRGKPREHDATLRRFLGMLGAVPSDSVLVVSANDQDFVLSDALLTRSDGSNFALTSIEEAQLTGGASANKFTVSGWSKTATIDGGSSNDTIISSNDTNFTLANGLLTRSDGSSFTLASIENAQLTGGASANSGRLAFRSPRRSFLRSQSSTAL